MKYRANEIDAINCFIDILGKLYKKNYVIEKRPDEENRKTKDIDFIIRSEDNLDKIAVEHTIIESFIRQIEYVDAHHDIIQQIEKELSNELPKDRYFIISFSHNILKDKNKKNKMKLKEILKIEILKSISNLQFGEFIHLKILQSPCIIQCKKGNSILANGLVPIQLSPEESQKMQIDRINKALIDKLPKLLKHKVNGVRTALLLEDVAGLGNPAILHKVSRCNQQQLKEIDYIIGFISINDQMIIGNIWKINKRLFNDVPMKYKFSFREKKET